MASSGRSRGGGSVHAIVGGKLFDSFLAEEGLESLLTATVGPDRGDALQVLQGDETTWARVIDAARMGSLFAARRALVVRGADALKGEGEEVAAYLEEPNPAVTLILIAARPDRRRVVWKRVLERATVVSAEPLKGRALRAYVLNRLRARDLRIADEGLEELLERFGQDLRRLMGEIDKLEAFAGGRRTLGPDDVAEVLGRGLARPLYLLGDAISERDAPRALALIDSLLDEGEEAPRILGTLYRSLRQMRRTRALQEAGRKREELAARLLPANMAFKLPALLEAARAWTEGDLRRAMVVLGEADRGMKTGAEVRTALAAAVTGACGRRPSRGPGPGP